MPQLADGTAWWHKAGQKQQAHHKQARPLRNEFVDEEVHGARRPNSPVAYNSLLCVSALSIWAYLGAQANKQPANPAHSISFATCMT